MPIDEQERKGAEIDQQIAVSSTAYQATNQLEAVFDAMADGLFVYDEKGQLVKTNTAGRHLLGGEERYRSPSSSLQEGVERFWLRNAQGHLFSQEQWPVIRLLQGEEFQGLEVLLQTLDGQERFLNLSGAPIRTPRGQITGGVIIVRDVTERKRSEEARRKNEELYRTIVQTVNEGIWLLDTSAKTVYLNERMASMLGYTTSELTVRTILDCVFPEDVTYGQVRFGNTLRGLHEQFELRLRRSDGSRLDALASTTPIRDTTGAIVGTLSLFTDITAHKQVEQALHNSEEVLRMALKNAPIAVFQQDRDLRYTWMYNPPSSTPENVVGKTDADFVSPEEAAHLTAIKQHVLASGEGVREEVQIKGVQSVRWEELSIEPLRDLTGTIVGLTGTAINITERRRLEQRTHQALEALLSMAQVMVQRSEPDQETRDFPTAQPRRMAWRIAELTRDVLGCERLSLYLVEPESERLRPLAVVGLPAEQEQRWWTEQEQSTSTLSDGLNPTDLARLRQQEVLILDLLLPPPNKHINPYGVRSALVAPLHLNGSLLGLLRLDYRGQAHTYTNEEIVLTQAACRLVALVIEREQLLATNQRLSDLIELAHDAVIVRDSEGRILFWNQGAEQLYGWTKAEAVGKVTHTRPTTHSSLAYKVADTHLIAGGQWEGVLTHTRRDGAEVLVESRQLLVRDTTGAPSAILEINRDITERERLAQERAEAQANEHVLREANLLMDEFIGIAGHELRTPLTTIKASVQLAKRQVDRLLKQDDLPPGAARQLSLVQGHLERTERQITMQNRLVSDLLDVSRIHADRLELNPDLCDLVTLVREVTEDQHYLTPERTLLLSLATSGEILVLADADRVRQVISNYLSNALKYSEATKPIEVCVEVIGMQVRVSVRDEGPGLSREQQQYIWERFYRVPTIEVKTGSGVGLGLGLHISRMLIERQRGQVGVQSEPGHGSTFWFLLPVAEVTSPHA